MPAMGPRVLARPAIEIGATAWWLMEPGIGVRRRTSGHLVLNLISVCRAAQVADELGDPDGIRSHTAKDQLGVLDGGSRGRYLAARPKPLRCRAPAPELAHRQPMLKRGVRGHR